MDDVTHSVQLVLVEAERLGDELVALDELGRGKAHGNAHRLRVIVDEVDDCVDAAVQGAAVRSVGRAEVLPAGVVVVASNVDGVLHELVDALVLGGRDRNHGDAEGGFESVDVDGPAVLGDLVHHVERDDHGYVELHELEREVEISLDVGGVEDVDDRVGLVVEDELTGDDLLARVGRERVDTREVRDRRLGMAAHLAVLAVDRDSREVAHVLVGAGQLIEERGLAAVLVTGEREGERLSLGGDDAHRTPAVGLLGSLARRGALAERGVHGVREVRVDARRVVRVVYVDDLDARGVGLAQCELVSAKANLERVAHGGGLDHGDLDARREPHVKDVLAERVLVAVDGRNDRILADFERVQSH